MLNHKQCEMARQFTGETHTDKIINQNFLELSTEEREQVEKEMLQIYQDTGDLTIIDLMKVQENHFVSLSVLFCVFGLYQAKNKK